MKTFLKIIVSFLFSFNFATATDFGSGPAVFARAFERVDHGYYNVYGAGLKNGTGFFKEFQYSVAGVKNSTELMSLIQFTYALNFDNYKSEVQERVDIVAANGDQLFVSEMTWKPEEILSQDGKTLAYQLPGHAGSIWLRLADQRIKFDGDSVEIELEGWTHYPEIYDGFVIVPGWVYEQRGSFVVWKNGKKIVTDIQTGKPVLPGKEVVQTRIAGIEGLVPVQMSGLTLILDNVSREYNPTCEAIAQQDGQLKIWIQDYFGNFPEGTSVTVVGNGAEPIYLHSTKEGYISLPVKKGQTLHIKSRWPLTPKVDL